MTKAQHWQNIIAQWHESGLTQRQYCSKHDINISSFGYWSKKLRQPESEQKTAGFIPLAVSSLPNASLTVQLGSLSIQCAANQLADILTVLEQRGYLHAAA